MLTLAFAILLALLRLGVGAGLDVLDGILEGRPHLGVGEADGASGPARSVARWSRPITTKGNTI